VKSLLRFYSTCSEPKSQKKGGNLRHVPSCGSPVLCKVKVRDLALTKYLGLHGQGLVVDNQCGWARGNLSADTVGSLRSVGLLWLEDPSGAVREVCRALALLY
jgi:hypothetical protein